MNRNATFELLENIKDRVSSDEILDELCHWLDTDTLNKALHDICKSFDLDIE